MKYIINKKGEIDLKLIELSMDTGNEFLEYLKEIPQNDNGFHSPGIGVDESTYHEFKENQIKSAKGIGLKEGYVAQTLYIAYVNDRVVGALKLRPELTDALRKIGGNIGYGIRMSERRKGYGSQMLNEALKICKEKGLTEVLLTCDQDNMGSRGVIESCGGILDAVEEDYRRYRIEL